MTSGKLTILFVALWLGLSQIAAVQAQDADALLDLLVRKKLISPKEAEEVRAEMKSAKPKTEGKAATAPAGSGAAASSTTFTESSKTAPILSSVDKWKLSTPIIELEL